MQIVLNRNGAVEVCPMTTHDENHIPEGRLVEISKNTADDFSNEERTHIAKCERCAGLLGALFRLERGDELA